MLQSTSGPRSPIQHNGSLSASSKAVEFYSYMSRQHYEGDEVSALADLLVDLAEEYGEDIFSEAVRLAEPIANERGVDLGKLVVIETEVLEIPAFEAPPVPMSFFMGAE